LLPFLFRSQNIEGRTAAKTGTPAMRIAFPDADIPAADREFVANAHSIREHR
jgi:hypothetical protein